MKASARIHPAKAYAVVVIASYAVGGLVVSLLDIGPDLKLLVGWVIGTVMTLIVLFLFLGDSWRYWKSQSRKEKVDGFLVGAALVLVVRILVIIAGTLLSSP